LAGLGVAGQGKVSFQWPRQVPRTNGRTMSDELDIQRAIMAALKAAGIWHRRNNTGKARGGKFMVGLGLGGPDLLVLHNGRAVSLEVKSATGKQRPEQVQWELDWVAAGGEYHIVRSVAEALAVVLRPGKVKP
jgi:hypothetical protein